MVCVWLFTWGRCILEQMTLHCVGSFQTCFADREKSVAVIGKRSEAFDFDEQMSFLEWLKMWQVKRLGLPRLHPEEHLCEFLEFLKPHLWVGDVDHVRASDEIEDEEVAGFWVNNIEVQRE